MDDFKRRSMEEEAAGTGEKLKGKIKEGAGKLTGNEELEAEGQVDQGEGTVRQKAGEAGSKVSDWADRAEDKLRGKD